MTTRGRRLTRSSHINRVRRTTPLHALVYFSHSSSHIFPVIIWGCPFISKSPRRLKAPKTFWQVSLSNITCSHKRCLHITLVSPDWRSSWGLHCCNSSSKKQLKAWSIELHQECLNLTWVFPFCASSCFYHIIFEREILSCSLHCNVFLPHK